MPIASRSSSRIPRHARKAEAIIGSGSCAFYADLDTALAKSKPDAALIVAPSVAHADLTIQLSRRGPHRHGRETACDDRTGRPACARTCARRRQAGHRRRELPFLAGRAHHPAAARREFSRHARQREHDRPPASTEPRRRSVVRADRVSAAAGDRHASLRQHARILRREARPALRCVPGTHRGRTYKHGAHTEAFDRIWTDARAIPRHAAVASLRVLAVDRGRAGRAVDEPQICRVSTGRQPLVQAYAQRQGPKGRRAAVSAGRHDVAAQQPARRGASRRLRRDSR